MEQIRRRWRKLPGLLALREIAILVIGILIAFALDAWWEQRSTAARERAHMHALTSDFRQNVQRLDQLIELEDRIAESSRTLLLLGRHGNTAPVDSLWRLFGMVFTANRFEPVMGTYEELENSAGLALLRDDSLRASLAEFAAQLNVRYYERFSDEVFLAFIREFAGELQLFAPIVADDHDPELFYRSSQQLLPTAKFQEYLALRHIAARDVASEYRRLAQQAQTVLTRLHRLSE